jgi:hypothetical protein
MMVRVCLSFGVGLRHQALCTAEFCVSKLDRVGSPPPRAVTSLREQVPRATPFVVAVNCVVLSVRVSYCVVFCLCGVRLSPPVNPVAGWSRRLPFPSQRQSLSHPPLSPSTMRRVAAAALCALALLAGGVDARRHGAGMQAGVGEVVLPSAAPAVVEASTAVVAQESKALLFQAAAVPQGEVADVKSPNGWVCPTSMHASRCGGRVPWKSARWATRAT